MRLVVLTRLFARRTRGDRATVALPVVAFAVVTLCSTVVMGGVSAFFTFDGPNSGTYRILALLALVLLVIPLASLSGAAARLSARRRDARLSSLRLLGASVGLVSALTVVESTGLAAAGAAVGSAASVAALPLFGLLHFSGHPLGAAIWPPAWVFPGVVGAVAVLSAASAIVGLRAVVLTPLGVRTRVVTVRVRWIRAVIAGAVVVGAFAAMSGLNVLGRLGGLVVIYAVLLGSFAAALAVLGLVGPFVLQLFGRHWLKTASKPAQLIAARTVLDDTKAAWRQVAALSSVSFVAVLAGVGVALTQLGSDSAQARLLASDIRTGVVLTLIMSFAMVACAIGVDQAAGILDRRALYRGLDRVGTPVGVMDAARRRAVMGPLLVVTIGSAVTAAIVMFPLTGYALLVQPLAVAIIAGCLAFGVALVWVGLAATRPVLDRVISAGAPDAA